MRTFRLRRPLLSCPVALALLATVPLTLAAQYPEWNRVLPLPAPSGPHSVGTRVLRMVDTTRPSSEHRSDRPLMVQLWYPISDTGTVRTPYIGEPTLIDTMLTREYHDVAPFILRGWRTILAQAWRDAPPAAALRAEGWPMLVLSHGAGVTRANYTALATAMASHGYVVVAIDHPISGFMLAPDGTLLAPGTEPLPYPDRPYARLTRDMALDAAFVLSQLPSNIVAVDTTRIGYFGHSLGGAAALEACLLDARFRACVDMDGGPFGESAERPIRKPFLSLLSQPDHRNRPPPADSAQARRRAEFDRMGRERDEEWAAIGQRNGAVPWHVVKILGTGHFSFSDAPFQLQVQLRDVGATMAPEAMHRLTTDLLLDFFGHYLEQRPLRRLQPGASTTP